MRLLSYLCLLGTVVGLMWLVVDLGLNIDPSYAAVLVMGGLVAAMAFALLSYIIDELRW